MLPHLYLNKLPAQISVLDLYLSNYFHMFQIIEKLLFSQYLHSIQYPNIIN
jgi:hypothetical protein